MRCVWSRGMLLGAILLFGAYPVWSQVDDLTRTPDPGLGHDYVDGLVNEIVNPENGSLSIRTGPSVPKGRGANVSLSLNYNTNDLNIPQDNMQYLDNDPRRLVVHLGRQGRDGGWQYTIPKLTTVKQTVTAPPQSCGDSVHVCTYYDDYQFTDATGMQHQLGLRAAPIQSSDCFIAGGPLSPQVFGRDELMDATLDPPSIDINSPVTISDLDGTTYRMDGAYGPDPGDPFNALLYRTTGGTVEDRNGNQISIVTSSSISNSKLENFTYTDSLGRTLISKTSTTPSTDVLAVTGLGGNYTIQWEQASFNEPAPNSNVSSGCQIAGIAGSYNAVQSITLPNNQQYQFEYDPTSGFVSRIIYPTGGWVRYTWGWNPLSHEVLVPHLQFLGPQPGVDAVVNCLVRFDNLAITKREVSFDGTNVALVQTFDYNTFWGQNFTGSIDIWDTKTTTVTTCDALRNPSALTSCNQSNAASQEVHIYKAFGENFPREETLISKDGGGTVLQTVKKTFLTERLLTDEQITLANGLVSLTHYEYNNGAGKLLVTETDEYDWGSGQPGPLLRKTLTNYLTAITTPMAGIISDLPASTIVQDGAGNQLSRTDFGYDQYGQNGQPGLMDTSGQNVVNHDYNHFGASYLSRGNLTSKTQWLNIGGTSPVTYFAYDDTGQVRSVTDPRGHITTYDYTDHFSSGGPPSGTTTNAFPTQVTYPTTSNGVGHGESRTYDYSGGRLTQHRDQNQQLTSYSYNDVFGRLTEVDSPDGGKTKYSFDDTVTNYSPYIRQDTLIDPSSNPPEWATSWTKFDGLGHVTRTARLNGEASPNIADQIDMCLDGQGHKWYETYPYQGIGWQPNTYHCPPDSSTPAGDRLTYDALGRLTTVTKADASTEQTDYSNYPTVLTTDEVGRRLQAQSDSLGRLLKVWEPDPVSGSLVNETDYQYDALGNVLCVHQKGSDNTPDKSCGDPAVPATWRPRFFTYDSLSRLLTASNPESGTVNYGYDPNGNLISKTEPAPNQIDATMVTASYSYDELDRLTSKTFSDNSHAAGFVYDLTPLWGVQVQNPVGQLVGNYATVSGLSGSVGSVFSYDVMGRVVYENHFNGHANTWLNKIFNYVYNLDGSTQSITYPSQRVVKYSYNAAQRVVSATNGNGSLNFATNVHYTSWGALNTAVNSGSSPLNGINTAYTYNARMRPTELKTWVASQPPVLDLNYDFNNCANSNGHDNGNVCWIINNKDNTRTQRFSYDSLNRLTQAWTPNASLWGTGYSHDIWGNLLQKSQLAGYNGGEQPLNVSVNSRNQVTSWCYDAAGNVVAPWPCIASVLMGPYPNVYDSENRLSQTIVQNGNTLYDYDPEGRRVKKSTGSIGMLYWYGPGGEVLEETDLNGVLQHDYVFVSGKRIARMDPAIIPSCAPPAPGMPVNCPPAFTPIHYYFADYLGSTDLVTNATGAVETEEEFYPYGGDRVIADSGIGNNYKFTGKERDPETGCDYFGARYYCNLIGRFITPDWAAAPTAVPYAHFGNPQSLNLYSYVGNNPTTLRDPDGHGWIKDHLKRTGIGAAKAVGYVLTFQPPSQPFSAQLDTTAWGVRERAEAFAQKCQIPTVFEPHGITEKIAFAATVGVLVFSGGAEEAEEASAAVKGAALKETGALEEALEGIPTIGGRRPINSKYAGGTHPSGVQFTAQGFPDFSSYAVAEVKLDGLTGNYAVDEAMANKAAGLESTPKDYVWHHVEDGETMQLVPKAIHNAVRHTGGAAVIRNGGLDH